MKQYSYRCTDPKFEAAIERWIEDGYSFKGMVEELIAKYEGLEVPKPSEVQMLRIEVTRQQREIERLKRDAEETVDVLISLIGDMEKIKADMAIPLSLYQPPSQPTSSPIVTE